MFDVGYTGFEGGMTARKYVSINKTSRATATRDLQELVTKNIFTQNGEGRNVSYQLNILQIFFKYKFISSNTARKTFITNSLLLGMEPKAIKKIANIKKTAVLDKYMKVVEVFTDEQMDKAWGQHYSLPKKEKNGYYFRKLTLIFINCCFKRDRKCNFVQSIPLSH